MQTVYKEILQFMLATLSTVYRNGTEIVLLRRFGDLNACAWSSSPARDVSCTPEVQLASSYNHRFCQLIAA